MYRIRRPPAHLKTFEMPTQEELIKLEKGSLVKVMFGDEFGNNVERMWTIIDSIGDDGWTEAKLDNDPFGLDCLKCGDSVKFHVTDIICIWED